MKISLSPDVERLIAERVQSGEYSSADQVVREGLELLRQYEGQKRPHPPNGSQPLDRVFETISVDVPDAEWQRVPTDLSKNVEKYLSERPKTS